MSLVWVTVGKTQHPAWAMEVSGDKTRVRWTMDQSTEYVLTANVQPQLSPRKRPLLYAFEDDKNTDDDLDDEQPITALLLLPDNDHKRPRPVSSSPTQHSTLDRAMDREPCASTHASATSATTHSDSIVLREPLVVESETLKTAPRACGPRDTVPEPNVIDLCHDDDDDTDDDDNMDLVSSDRSILSLVTDRPRAPVNSLEVAGGAPSAPAAPMNDTTVVAAAPRQEYSLKSSAYLQNLAEICFTILCDVRWTGLFRWECGDDLSVTRALSRHFVPHAPPVRVPCHCLLCRDKPPSEVASDVAIEGVGDDTVRKENDLVAEEKQEEGDDDDEVKSLYLYSRLYYRKGPWFRIDNIYSSYYIPKRRTGEETKQETQSSSSKTAAPAKPIDEEVVQKHLNEHVPRMLQDLQNLKIAGYIRNFNDEIECGEVVGRQLLKAEERGVLLTKLGGSKKQKGSNNEENMVLKQMRQQRSLFSTAKHLPVHRHVQDILLEALSRTIVQSASRVDYIPAKTMRIFVASVKSALQKMIKAQFGSLGLVCCLLREEPLLTLQRCVRLYLCATSGPGDMRGDGSNGWRSVRETRCTWSPYNRLIPPGRHSWYQIQYPALAYRFGLKSSCFVHSYQHLPVNQENESVQPVFLSRESFLRWEMSAELRASVDYLTELNEMIRYDARRVERGKDPIRTNNRPIDIDFLSILTSEGRTTVFSIFASDREALNTLAIVSDVKRCSEALDSDCEKVLGTIGVMIMNVLATDVGQENRELKSFAARPWLRHLTWQACLAYVLWDIIPIFERGGLHCLAVQCLEVLLFGSLRRRDVGPHEIGSMQLLSKIPLISRRAAGKAVDRLIIDITHLHRTYSADKDKQTKKSLADRLQSQISSLCMHLVELASPTSAIGFSTLRIISRRLKQPLSRTMGHLHCLEASSLGLRLAATDVAHPKETANKYSDWSGIVDLYQANALASDEISGPGARCAFVGCEDDADDVAVPSSLNVEELAMELYRTGRLPTESESESSGGEWRGFHDEGGHLRALFRIICGAALLGMDFGCSLPPNTTIHLSPYQSAPFDLHVGFQLCDKQLNTSSCDSLCPTGFFFRRSDRIDRFLTRLASLDSQGVSDVVFEAVSGRLRHMKANGIKDPFLDRDLKQMRTLSAIAAGLGGKQLAAAFRCLLFDYRHYSGGLPDLLLFRAALVSESNERIFVDLGEWIGESFSIEYQQELQAKQAADILIDRDDEFLGCSKVGDSGGQSNRSRRMAAGQVARSTGVPSTDSLPARLELVHCDEPVKVECMFVEVKSSNDRLDPRQEDWLNVLDRHGNARVCKFFSTTKKKKAKSSKAQKLQESESVTMHRG